MLHNYLREVKQKKFWRRISQSEIRNSAAESPSSKTLRVHHYGTGSEPR